MGKGSEMEKEKRDERSDCVNKVNYRREKVSLKCHDLIGPGSHVTQSRLPKPKMHRACLAQVHTEAPAEFVL